MPIDSHRQRVGVGRFCPRRVVVDLSLSVRRRAYSALYRVHVPLVIRAISVRSSTDVGSTTAALSSRINGLRTSQVQRIARRRHVRQRTASHWVLIAPGRPTHHISLADTIAGGYSGWWRSNTFVLNSLRLFTFIALSRTKLIKSVTDSHIDMKFGEELSL